MTLRRQLNMSTLLLKVLTPTVECTTPTTVLTSLSHQWIPTANTPGCMALSLNAPSLVAQESKLLRQCVETCSTRIEWRFQTGCAAILKHQSPSLYCRSVTCRTAHQGKREEREREGGGGGGGGVRKGRERQTERPK